MKATVETIDSLHKTIKVEIPWDMVSQELDLALKDLAKDAEIKGFRKGKVPRNVLQKRFGKKVEAEVIARLVQESYETALIQHKVQPVARPELEKAELKEGEPYCYTARVEVAPDIELKPYAFDLDKPKAAVEPEKIQSTIERMREQKAVLVPIEGRDTAQEGDTLVLDYVASLDGKPIRGGDVKNYEVTLGAKQAVPGFEENLNGIAKGQTRVFDVVFPQGWGNADLAGKPVRFSVTLQALNKRELPEVNDEFAKELGRPGCETIEALKQEIEKEILRQEEKRIEHELREKLLDQLIAANEFPLPPTLLERQQEALVQEAEYYLSRQGMDPRGTGMNREQMKTDLKGRAEREVRAALLLATVAQKEKIHVEDQDVQAHLADLAQRTGQNIQAIKGIYQDPQTLSSLKNRLLHDKVLDYLMTVSNINPKDSQPSLAAEEVAAT